MKEPRVPRSRLTGVAGGLAAGALVGAASVVLAGTAVAHRLVAGSPEPLLEATHLPPLLTAPGEPVELRYDIFCTTADETDADAPCDSAGSVFIRAGQAGPFSEIVLRRDMDAAEGRFVASVPDATARSPFGFAYYAVIASKANGKTVTLPGGGAAAPQRSMSLFRGVVANLPPHAFGRTRAADRRIAEASWGTGPGEVGLEDPNKNLSPIGGSSFDVSSDGTVHVLDEANRRLLRWQAGAASPQHVRLDISGTLADMSVAPDGTVHVLETAHAGGNAALLRTFDASGDERDATELAERASQVRIGPMGPVVFNTTSGQWMAAADRGRGLSPAAQRVTGRSGRPLVGGREVVVFRDGNEIRMALIGPGSFRQTWRVVSETPLAEVQLAEPLGNRLVVVVRTYTDHADEFVVLVLGSRGIEERFSLESSDWAETAPLSRFRLVGPSLYRLGSTPAGLFVDRIDLEVKR
jgi:hypothetical protein